MDARREAPPAERSLGELFGDLSNQLSTLVRQEIALARTELGARVGSAGRGAAMVGVGGAVAYAGFLGILAAIAFLLVDAGLPAWVAAAIVGVVTAVIGAVVAMRGRQQLAETDLTPRRTLETIRDDTELAKERLK